MRASTRTYTRTVPPTRLFGTFSLPLENSSAPPPGIPFCNPRSSKFGWETPRVRGGFKWHDDCCPFSWVSMSAHRDQGKSEAALLLLATDQRVHAYDLARFSRVSIGRHESNEIRLLSRAVSNFHAEILKEDGALVIQDLGSTNGTRVNGERVERSRVSPGDSIRIGNHVLSLELRPPPEATDVPHAGAGADRFGPGCLGRIAATKARAAESGSEMSLPDLLRRLAALPGAHRILLKREGRQAQVLFNGERLFHAEYEGAIGEKALYRLFGWHEGTYEIQLLDGADSLPVSICLPLDALIVEGLDHAQELGKLVASLPPLANTLRLNEDCPLPLTAHSPAEIEIFQAIIRHETIEKVLEKSPWTDVRIARLIESLLRKGVFAAASPGELDETHNLV